MLQKEYNIVVAGPITMFAILNSFLIGFKTLEVNRRILGSRRIGNSAINWTFSILKEQGR